VIAVRRGYRDGPYGQVHFRIALPPAPSALPPVLCLHQTPSNGGEWEPLMLELARDRVVVAPDNPGYGMSDAPPAPCSISDFARVASGVLGQLREDGIVPPGAYDIVGAHTGSIVGTELALTDSNVRRVVLFGLAAYDANLRAAKLANLRNHFPAPDATLNHVERLWAIFGALGDARQGAEARHVAMAECLRLGSRMPWGYEAVYRYDFLDALARLRQPALIVNAEDDLAVVTRSVAHLVPHGRLLELPGRAHGFLAFDAAEVAADLRGFLD
jgi:pimeloyl-ACP methyl ester carboxylesterase